MHDLSLASRRGGKTRVEGARLEAFRAAMRGETLLPGEPGYDQARAVWNAMIDRRPALVARCAGVADVLRCVELAREHDLLVAVRGGGHNIAGKAVCDDGLVVDLSRLREVRVDPGARTARVGPGATLADLDHETQAFGLATPLGINSTTGVAGLTLGGGFGWLTRKLGMTADNLRSADVVTADGQLLHTSEKHEPDLLWGLRGGREPRDRDLVRVPPPSRGSGGRVPVSTTAYPHRDAYFFMNVHARWESRAGRRGLHRLGAEGSSTRWPRSRRGGSNFMSEDDDRVGAAYGANYDRLAQLKTRYDPTNLFHVNQNVPPVARV